MIVEIYCYKFAFCCGNRLSKIMIDSLVCYDKDKWLTAFLVCIIIVNRKTTLFLIMLGLKFKRNIKQRIWSAWTLKLSILKIKCVVLFAFRNVVLYTCTNFGIFYNTVSRFCIVLILKSSRNSPITVHNIYVMCPLNLTNSLETVPYLLLFLQ